MIKPIIGTLLCSVLVACSTHYTATTEAAGQSTPYAPAMNSAQRVFAEQDGMVVIEAEHFSAQALADVRRWTVFDADTPVSHGLNDADLPHPVDASNGAYIEILPDTRTNHDEVLISGENFSAQPGVMGVLSYPIQFSQTGRYYLWGRAFSTGSEDNGVHFGIDGSWPESSQRLQLCEGKNSWTWSSQQRRPDNHCGTPSTLWIDIDQPGLHHLMVSMREDGFELDKIILALDPGFIPAGISLGETLYQPKALPPKTAYKQVLEYRKILGAAELFEPDPQHAFALYHDKNRDVMAVNAVKPDARDKFFRWNFTVPTPEKGNNRKRSVTYANAQLVTLAEIDGESKYRVWLNNQLLAEVQNPETNTDYQEIYFPLGELTLAPGDVLSVESMAVTNGKIPENGGTAFARGRWRGLVLN
ncbi:hypothetical protein DXV75_09015 [Alteromonas aestuariivivens]|uniref:Uncharacterized protein n=1 Tax=Alteromonas aestuariivivens TaxID=1938339 RepID=A0A3D8M6V9_9ALTE|nr:hypothetical protein [Alteromonas aestuariivivens]RDV25435.1 hypothetical protein DXV75_09015 [Alteromonas aestuariivivens]